MSTVEDEIKALKAVIARREAEYDASTDRAERSELRQLITAKENRLTELLKAQAPASSSTAATEARVEEVLKKFVTFQLTSERLVTAWVSGARMRLNTLVDFDIFLSNVEESFDLKTPRIFVLKEPGFDWHDRIRLTAENFNDFQNSTGMFATKCKVYACGGDDSPQQSPGNSPDSKICGKSDKDDGSNRSGQSEFNESIIRRDKGNCVFCGSSETLEGAHILPVKYKHLLYDPEICKLYRIDSINDSCNGIALCWGCHKCFDANLICINPVDHKLLIADALIANEGEKYQNLVGLEVFPRFCQWPKHELLQYRVDAMEKATRERHANQAYYKLCCSICGKGYCRLFYLKKHEEECERTRKPPAMYNTPAGKATVSL